MQEAVNSLKAAWKWFSDALFPPKCLVCRCEGKYLCNKHHHFLPAPPNEAEFQFLDDIFAVSAYHDPIAEKAVEFFKFRGFQDVTEILVKRMVEGVPKNFFEDAVLIPVPLHWTRKLWRGFNQAELLVRGLQKELPRLQISTDLRRVRRTKQQARLKKVERIKNLGNAFVWQGKDSIPSKVVLIDDVVASGATLDAAAFALKKVGVEKVSALVFARGGKDRT